jgi:hypothetical protein
MRKLFLLFAVVTAMITLVARVKAETSTVSPQQATMTCEGTFGCFFGSMESENYKIEASSFQPFAIIIAEPTPRSYWTADKPTIPFLGLAVLGPKAVPPHGWYEMTLRYVEIDAIPLTEAEMAAIHAP